MLRAMFALAITCLFPVGMSAQQVPVPDSVSSLQEAKSHPGEWVWLPMEGMQCRDGSTTGIGIRIMPETTAVMIYLQGGGACYGKQSCAENSNAPIAGANYSKQKFAKWIAMLGNQGVFNSTNPQNPVARWNHIYVPYCSGDLHGGTRRNVSVPGVPGKQQFTGYQNVSTVLKTVAPAFRGAQDVALVGASAGGVGVLINYPQTVEAFGGRSVVALVDSAPVIPESSIKTSCFQKKLADTFDLQLPADCPECRDPAKGGLVNIYKYLGKKYPKGRFALASADADLAGVLLYDRESRACRGGGVNIFNYRMSLYALRDRYMGDRWATFLPGGLQHTMTQSDELFLKRKFKGVSAGQWLARINTAPPSHVPARR